MKKHYKHLLYIVFLILIFLFIGEAITRSFNLRLLLRPLVKSNPPNFFQPDSILGWKVHEGEFEIQLLDTSNVFYATVNNDGERISSNLSDINLKNRPIIHLYGCSFTFGFSVNDSSTMSFKLQKLLSEYEIKNKGVPGYGLTQMYLSIKQSLIKNDTPQIAVFNYASFHNDRTPKCRNWNLRFGYAISQSYTHKFKYMKYPYMDYKNDSLFLKYQSYENPLKLWPLAESSYFINFLNAVYNYQLDSWESDKRAHVAMRTAIKIVDLCKKNNIIPIFTNVTAEVPCEEFFQTLNNIGCLTLNYGVHVITEDHTKSIYNCGPIDPGHPSGLAHTIYANNLCNFIKNRIYIKENSLTNKFN